MNQWELPLIPLPRELPPLQIPVSIPPPAMRPLPPHSSYKKVEIGGYHYQFVDEEKLPDECTCPICTLVQREAHQVICCGKIYCKSCLDELKRKSVNFKCPNCCNSLEGEHKYFPDKNTISKIHHFAIYCDNKDKGCQWEGLLKDFEEGHLPKCPYQIISCSNNCGMNLQHQELDRHLIQCPRRQFTCPFCKTRGEHRNITGDHITTCPDYILECPNTGCDEGIKRSQIAKHRNECSKEIVPCPHSSIGCSSPMIKREELLSHDKERVSFHLDLAVKKIHELKHDQERVSSHHDLTIRELRCDLHRAVKEIHELRAQRPFTADKIPVIKMQNYLQHNISTGFYLSPCGYKMALKICLYHNFDCYLALLPGEYDNTLEWPFQGVVTVELLNQKEDKDHDSTTIFFNEDTPDKYKNRVVPPKVNGEWRRSISYLHKRDKYTYNNTLYLRVSIKTTEPNKPWLV